MPSKTPVRTADLQATRLAGFLVLAFGFAWALWVPAALASRGTIAFPLPTDAARLLGVFAPTAAALVLTAWTEGVPEVRYLVGRLARWRVGAPWYAFALLWPPAVIVLAGLVATGAGAPLPDYAAPPLADSVPLPPELQAVGPWPLLPVVFLQTLLVGSPLGEELGWRGYALPRLQARWQPLWAAVLLGGVWAVWHAPLFMFAGDPLAQAALAPYVVGIVLDSVLFAWLFDATDGSLLPCVLFHASIAVAGLFVAGPGIDGSPIAGSSIAGPASQWLPVLLTAALVAAIVARYGTDLGAPPAQTRS